MAKSKDGGRIEPRFGDEEGDFAVTPDERPAGRARPKTTKPASARRGGGRRGKAEKPRGSFGRRLLRRTIYWGFVASIWGVIVLAGIVGYYASQLPAASEWTVPKRPPNVEIVGVDGSVIGNRGEMGGDSIEIHQLPDYVPNAVIAIEDRRFRSHFGVDPVGLTRAALHNFISGDIVGGGSTLTQQLAKNLFLTPEQTIRRKIQEAIMAVWLETKYSKDDILQMYLNRVYFGAGAYGIDAAANRYFERDASELTIAQAAMLAGVLPAPSYYAPNKNPDAAKKRAALVVDAMRREGFITPEQAEEALAHPAEAVSLHMTRSENYIADWVMDVLPFHVGAIESDVVVETTVDPKLQRAAEAAVQANMDEHGQEYGAGEAALVALDGTGAVRAMVGGRNYAQSQFNRAVSAKRQPGSAFKPFVYLAALERGMTPETIVEDEPVSFGNWAPQNHDGEYRGPVTLKMALAYSINTVAAKLAMEVGPETVVETARRLGINSPLAPNGSIALGTSEVTLIELTGAYAPLSNGGYAALPYVIQRIRTTDGSILFDRTRSGLGRVISLDNVAMMNDMLKSTLQMGTGKRAAIAGWPAAGKTGTSQDFRDAWFMGYTANLTAGVWVGNDSNAPTKHASGSNLPSMIWHSFMEKAHEGVPVADLPGTEILPAVMAQRQSGFGMPGIDQANAQGAPSEALNREWILNGQGQPVQGAPPPERPRGILDLILGR